ncbi:hypothetical protein Pst134EA_015970, partial [Puccinia striiformis f. sp. tritici]|uniref:hypothetical protein n=1 Tax=Puccinia striiformis f. sp. tritici TaxID=168172 RepID=UPI00200844DA
RLSRKEVKWIEDHYNLSVQFPNPFKEREEVDKPLLEGREYILVTLEKCLGITGPVRPEPLTVEQFGAKSKISELIEELRFSNRYNGLNIKKVIGLIEMFHIEVPSQTIFY